MEHEIFSNLLFANSPEKVGLISVIYLYIVIYAGPWFMKNKQPLGHLKPIISVYNFLQIIFNSWFVYIALSNTDFTNDIISNLTGDNVMSEKTFSTFVVLSHGWFCLKMSDLLDTIFFIALKKHSHISFLHVYHHVTTMLVAFVVTRYIQVKQAVIYAGVNCCVHVVMYTYYFLTSIGLKPKWKKFVTSFQIMQFLSLIILTCVLVCKQTNSKYLFFSVYSLFQCVMYLYLFGIFYIKNYSRKMKNLSEKTE